MLSNIHNNCTASFHSFYIGRFLTEDHWLTYARDLCVSIFLVPSTNSFLVNYKWNNIWIEVYILNAHSTISDVLILIQGRGNKSSGDNFHAAPNIDHSQEFVRKDLKEWLCWLR